MPQLFPRFSNTIVKLSVIVAPIALVLIVYGAVSVTRSPYNTKATIPIAQPIPFSHKHHFTELGIDCRYCHTSVDKSSFAGIPPTETCMTCHSLVWTNSPLLQPARDSYATGAPIRWNKVHRLPDFVYFNHSIHVAKGVSCFTCHGQVDQMQLVYKAQALNMIWCLDCHRNPEKFIRPVEEIYNANYKPAKDQMELGKELVEKYGIKKAQLTNCAICHR